MRGLPFAAPCTSHIFFRTRTSAGVRIYETVTNFALPHYCTKITIRDHTQTFAPARVPTYDCAGTNSFVTTGYTISAVLAIIVIIGRARDDPMKLSLNHKEIYYDRSQVKSFYELILIRVQSVK